MEFLEFCKQRERMCDATKREECNLFRALSKGCLTCKNDCIEYYDAAEKIVSEWSKEHPIIRNCDKLHEVFGNNFKMMMHDTFNVFISYNGEEISMNEWMYREYKEPEEDNN